MLEDVVDESRLVIDAHLLPIEVPELLLLRVHRDVPHRMNRASVTSHPHIEPSSSQLERNCLIGRVDDPTDGSVLKAMLEHDSWFGDIWIRVSCLDSLELEDVAIFGLDEVLLVVEAILLNDLPDWLETVVQLPWLVLFMHGEHRV